MLNNFPCRQLQLTGFSVRRWLAPPAANERLGRVKKARDSGLGADPVCELGRAGFKIARVIIVFWWHEVEHLHIEGSKLCAARGIEAAELGCVINPHFVGSLNSNNPSAPVVGLRVIHLVHLREGHERIHIVDTSRRQPQILRPPRNLASSRSNAAGSTLPRSAKLSLQPDHFFRGHFRRPIVFRAHLLISRSTTRAS